MTSQGLLCSVVSAVVQSPTTTTTPSVVATAHSSNEVEGQVDGDEDDRDADRLAGPAQEDRAEQGQQDERDQHPVVAEQRRHVRVLRDVRGRVRRRQRHGDEEVGGHAAMASS
jgi:hypothetical protein